MIIEVVHKKSNEKFEHPLVCLAAAMRTVSNRLEMQDVSQEEGIYRITSHCLNHDRDEVYVWNDEHSEVLFIAQYAIQHDPHYGPVYVQIACTYLQEECPKIAQEVHKLYYELAKDSDCKWLARCKRISDKQYTTFYRPINKLN